MPDDDQERAVAAWVEVEADGVPVLCLDTDQGRTVPYELSPKAARGLKSAIVDGPQVRHDEG